MTARSAIARAAAGLLLALLPAAPALATTYVMLPDEALVDQAAVVAQATVAAVEPAPIADPPATDYFVQIERVLKGHVAGGTVVVRVPGGIGPDGVGLRIWGMPEFREGERLVLFLAPRADGTYGILHLMLGAFYEVESGGTRVAVRALAEGQAAEREAAEAEPLRDFTGFLNWITDRAAGVRRPIDYYLRPAPAAPRAMLERAHWLEDPCTQLGYRWFEFERGEAVRWSFDARGLDGRGGGRASLDRARRVWNRDRSTPVRLLGGGGPADGGLTSFDQLNGVLFEDPHGTIPGSFRCSAGGVVSLSGLWFESGRGQECERRSAGRKGAFGGRQFLEILGADVVVNDGAGCLLARDPGLATRVLAHELGHSLGLSHGEDPDALMWGAVRDGDGRGLLSLGERRDLASLYR